MSVLNSSIFFESKSLTSGVFEVEGAEIEWLELSQALKDDLLALDDYDSVLDDAADYGLGRSNDRVVLNEKKKPYIDDFWAQKPFKDPSVKQLFGAFICSESGLGDFMADLIEDRDAKIEAERLALEENGITTVDSDDPNFDMTAKIEDLDDDFNAAIAVNS